jgi:hypothetical protein
MYFKNNLYFLKIDFFFLDEKLIKKTILNFLSFKDKLTWIKFIQFLEKKKMEEGILGKRIIYLKEKNFIEDN